MIVMHTNSDPEINELVDVIHYRPAVSIIMPFEPKMGLKAELTHLLKLAADKVGYELMDKYPYDTCIMVIQKINAIIKTLNFNTHKKSIAIFVSPIFEKVLYLDIPVEEKIIIDESFEIRDLVYSKKQLHKYLVLILSSKENSIFLGNSSSFITLVSNSATSVNAAKSNLPEKVANFLSVSDQKEILMDKFLQHTDNSLTLVLKAYQLPLFVLGTDRIMGHFKKLTKHNTAVIEYIHGNYEEASQEELKQILLPHITDWKKVIQKDLLNRLDEAAGKKKLALGIKDVWRAAMNKKGRLLVVEKNYMYAAEHGSNNDVIYKITEPYNKFSYIKDAVDDVMEKVLENGGDVEFVDEGKLKDYHRIALIQYY